MFPTDVHAHTSRCWWDGSQARWICAASASAGAHDTAPVDVWDMVVVHAALLRELRLAAGLVRTVEPAARRRVRKVTNHLNFVTALLHRHHAGEDSLLWPKLRQRAPGDVAPLLELMRTQHEAIDAVLTGVRAMLPVWNRSGDPELRDRLADDLTVLYATLAEHLDAEERDLLPLAARTLTTSEWHEIGEAAVAAMAKPNLPLVFGMFAYEGDPAVLVDMLRTAPAAVRLLLPRIAPRVYARHARALYGTSTP